MPPLARYASLCLISSILAGCSHARYGEDIVFSHSLPAVAEITQCACEAPAPDKEEDLQIIVYFGTDLYALNEEAVTTLESLVAAVDGRELHNMAIVGHTDSRASDSYNDTLSKRRAHAVIDYLKGRGLSSKAIDISWRGESTPAADNKTQSGMALNRRSVVTVKVAGR